MPKKRDALKEQQMWQVWHGKAPIVEVPAGQEGITGDAPIKTAKKKAKTEPPPKRDPISFEESLENFLKSSCFLKYVCDATEDRINAKGCFPGPLALVQLHPYRLSSGYFWTCTNLSCPAPYETIELQLPTFPDFLYKLLMKKHDNNHWTIGFEYRKSTDFESYKKKLREQLRQELNRLSA